MSEEIFAQLFDFGALGLFAGFLIWQHLGMQKRLDAVVERFQEQLREIEAQHEARVEVMRERYDLVIDKIRDEGAAQLQGCMHSRDALTSKLGDQIVDNAKAVAHAMIKQDTVLTKLDEGLTEMRLHLAVRRLKDDS
jgi:hypothetical protein